MARSLFKGPLINSLVDLKQKKIKIIQKSLIISPDFINKDVFVYNGSKFIKLKVKEEMIGYKFGEFINTRARYKYKKK